MSLSITTNHNYKKELFQVINSKLGKRRRTFTQFVIDEIVLPKGSPFEGQRFNPDYPSPIVRLILKECEKPYQKRIFVAGSQSGKTLISIAWLLYVLFELEERSIYAVPSIPMANDKLICDILPILEQSRFSQPVKMLQGGKRDYIQFSNNVILKFISAGPSNDRSKQGYTSKNITATEVDGLSVNRKGSEESDKLTLIESRTSAFGSDRRICYESTPSTENGRIWVEYLNSTQSYFVFKCPHCKNNISPRKENLKGWEVENELDINCYIECPECKNHINEEQRRYALKHIEMIHTRQSSNFGIRWGAIENGLLSLKEIGERMYNASKRVDRTNADREISQLLWGECYSVSEQIDTIDISTLEKLDTITTYAHMEVPSKNQYLCASIDASDTGFHYVVTSFYDNDKLHIVDYGFVKHDKSLPNEQEQYHDTAKRLNDILESGYYMMGDDNKTMSKVIPDYTSIDYGYRSITIKEIGYKYNWMPIKGYADKGAKSSYVRKGQFIDGCVWDEEKELYFTNTNLHKHEVLSMIASNRLSVYTGSNHTTLYEHINAEDYTIDSKGYPIFTNKNKRQNHYFDVVCYCYARTRIEQYIDTNKVNK